MLEVTYTTTIDDYVQFSMHSMDRSPELKRQFNYGWIQTPLVCLICAAILAYIKSPLAIVIFGVGAAHALIYPVACRIRIRRGIRGFEKELTNSGTIGRITLVLTDDTFTEKTKSYQTSARWQDMDGIEVIGDCTYIFVAGESAAIIPAHGFDRLEEYYAVQEFARARLPVIGEGENMPVSTRE